MRRTRASAWLAALAAGLVASASLAVPPTAAQPKPFQPALSAPIEPVAGRSYTPPKPPPDPEGATPSRAAKDAWPARGVVTLTVPAHTGERSMTAGAVAGSLPMWLGAAGVD